MPKTIKMYTKDGKWIVDDGHKVNIFDTAFEAWCFIFILKEIRPKVPCKLSSLYPVRSLNPLSVLKKKNVVWGELKEKEICKNGI